MKRRIVICSVDEFSDDCSRSREPTPPQSEPTPPPTPTTRRKRQTPPSQRQTPPPQHPSPLAECEVCCEKINKTKNKPIKCSFCDYTACQTCCQTFILGSIREANCMSCKKVWGREFLVENFTQKFVKTDYKNHREKTFYDRERALLPQTQPLVELLIRKTACNDKIKDLTEKLKVLNFELSQARNELYDISRDEMRAIRAADGLPPLADDFGFRYRGRGGGGGGAAAAAATAPPEKKFITKCPSDECRGFLSEDDYSCGLCGTKCCKKCNVILPPDAVKEGATKQAADVDDETKEKKKSSHHECKPDDLETAKLIRKDTKPCPSCGALIHKIDGCNQMWCTQCHTAFDWRTGEVEKGNIHNPEYFRYLREKGENIPRAVDGGAAAAAAGAAAAAAPRCDRVDNLFIQRIVAFRDENIITSAHKTLLVEMCRNVVHHTQVTIGTFQAVQNQTRNRDLRVNYLLGKINEKDFASILQQREKSNEKKNEIRNVVEMFVAASSDIILRFADVLFTRVNRGVGGAAATALFTSGSETEEERNWNDFETEMNALVTYTNDRLSKIAVIYGCKIYTFKASSLALNAGERRRRADRHRWQQGFVDVLPATPNDAPPVVVVDDHDPYNFDDEFFHTI